MRIEKPVIEGTLLKRYKRFLTDVELDDGSVIVAHCPNTGSLEGCKEPGSRVILRDSEDPSRKLRYTWQTIRVGETWVNVDTGLPNVLVAEAIAEGRIPALRGYPSLRREVKYGKSSRIDILLEKKSGARCWVEVKSTTLARGETALFPDAVTERGRKHLEELVRMVHEGDRAIIFFLVSRGDVKRFAPADDVDPVYGETLRWALAEGVEALAYSTRVEPTTIALDARLRLSGLAVARGR